MKKIFLIILLAFLSKGVLAQTKEWSAVVDLLNKEAIHFSDKNGYIQLMTSEYNTFFVDEFLVNDTLFVSAMWLKDRFENTSSELYLKETIELFYDEPIIESVQISYNDQLYFESFPDEIFLLIKLEQKYPHTTTLIQKNIVSKEEKKTFSEQFTDSVKIPVRRKNLQKILNAIDKYQLLTIKEKLESDRTH